MPVHARTLDCLDLGDPGIVGIAKPFNKSTICQPAANPTCNFLSSFFDPREICQWTLSDKNKPLIYRARGKARILMSQIISVHKLLYSRWSALRIQASQTNRHQKELKSPACSASTLGTNALTASNNLGLDIGVYIIKAVTFPHLEFHFLPEHVFSPSVYSSVWEIPSNSKIKLD